MNNAANRLTLLRGLLIPFLAAFFLIPSQWSNQVAAVILAIAAITDYLDGFVARTFNQETKIGAYLDQAIDKVLVVSALLLILFRYPYWYILLPVSITVLREFMVLSLRDWFQNNATMNVAVNWIGKLKTVIQFLSLICIFWVTDLNDNIGRIGLALLYLATLMTLLSAGFYLYANLKEQAQNQSD